MWFIIYHQEVYYSTNYAPQSGKDFVGATAAAQPLAHPVLVHNADYIDGLKKMIEEAVRRGDDYNKIADWENAALLYKQAQELLELLLELTGR